MATVTYSGCEYIAKVVCGVSTGGGLKMRWGVGTTPESVDDTGLQQGGAWDDGDWDYSPRILSSTIIDVQKQFIASGGATECCEVGLFSSGNALIVRHVFPESFGFEFYDYFICQIGLIIG